MPNTALTLVNIKDEIIAHLGGSGVHVELQPSDIETFLRETLRIYNRNRPMRGRASLPVNSTTKRYAVTHPGLQGIVEVQFVEKAATPDTPIDPFYYGYATVMQPGDTTGEYAQRLGHIDMARRVGSSEPEWQAEWEGAQLYLYVSAPYPVYASYQYTWHVTPDNNAQTGMQFIPDGDVDLIMGYVKACAKHTLSFIRGKFAGITGPDGATQEVDWQRLADEAKEEKEKLMEEFKARRRPLLPEIE